MQRTRIKFCGITRPQDGIAAADAGADAIGLIFYPKSKRFVTVEQARDVLAVLPPMVSPIALFVDAPTEEILHTVATLNIRTVQLHGNEPPAMLPRLPGLTIIKAICFSPINMRSVMETWRDAAEQHCNLAGILLETRGDAPGGSGIENDWAGLEMFFKARSAFPPLIAAGGLTPENVGGVVQRLHPYAVDVSTGIEETAGMKSVEKMKRFADQVRHADQVAPV